MKRFFSCLILVAIGFIASAQDTKISFTLLKKINETKNENESISVLIKGNVNNLKEAIPNVGGHVKFIAGDIIAAEMPLFFMKQFALNTNVIRMEEGIMNLEPMNDKMRINNHVNAVHAGLSPLTTGYKGNGVILGVIDTGIDITHPDFKDSLGNTRILWVWDHTLPTSGNTPQPYNYGQQFSAADIIAGLASATDDIGAHGTHVTGIAASNGSTDTIFTGVAPKADIISVKLNFNIADNAWLSSIADAVNYIFNKADSLNKPCVINISAGTYNGSHDGKDLQAQTIDNLITAKNGRCVVAAAGNAGNVAHHLLHQPTAGDTLFTWFANNSSNAIYIELWADTSSFRNMRFSLGSDALNPVYNNVAQDQWMGIIGNIGVLRNDSLMSFTGNRIARYQTYGQQLGSRYSFIFYILPDSTFNFFRLMSTGTGKFDVWSFDMIDYGLPAPGTYPNINNYVLPDYDKTICSSFQASDKVITVGQYVNRNNYVDYNGNLQTFPTTEGALAVSSSKGPTRDGRIKPDITSTGEYTMSALPASAQAWFIANQPFKLAYDGKHIRDGGTSSAAPVVAGVAALYFEAHPNASWQDVKNKIMYCSKNDAFTGTQLPNNNWGHGKLDAMMVMTGCSIAGTTAINNANFSCYPNPTRDIVHLNFPSSNKRTIELYSVIGTCLYKFETTNQENEMMVSNYENGVYILRISEGNQTQTKKLIIQK
ncbi:MAG: S8/S53 family peptidase [Bacteroidota bacterium]